MITREQKKEIDKANFEKAQAKRVEVLKESLKPFVMTDKQVMEVIDKLYKAGYKLKRYN